MAIVDPSNPDRNLRGKVGGMIYARQADGSVTVRSMGLRTIPPTEGEQKGQRRMKLGHPYVHCVLNNPTLKAPYATEAQRLKKRTCDLVMSDFLKNPVIAGVEAIKYNGLAGGCLVIITGDDFKVVRVGVVIRSATGARLEEGFAVLAQGSKAQVWIYTAQTNLPAGQMLTIEMTATDRAGHSTVLTRTHPI